MDRVAEAVSPALSAHGVSLVDIEWLTDQAGWVLRITIERQGAATMGLVAEAGVTLEDCVNVSRDVSSVLDVGELIPHRYHLEVSSPGLDRPLKRPADFVRFVGQLARVKLSAPAADGQMVLRGRLAEAPPEMVAVVVDGKKLEAPFSNVVEANLIFELQKQPKSAAAQRRGEAKRPAENPSNSAGPSEGRRGRGTKALGQRR